MTRFSFREYLLMMEDHGGKYDSIADKAVDMMRAVRDEESDTYQPDSEVRELIIYCLEEIEKFVIKELATEKDQDEANHKLKTFRGNVFKQIKKIAKGCPAMDPDPIYKTLDKLFADAAKVIMQ
jgi:hypothetical protein